ncbi:hypothetical protein ACFS3C_08880 [Azotobacter vinelandii]
MSDMDHRPGVREAYLVKRHLKLEALDAARADAIAQEIDHLVGGGQGRPRQGQRSPGYRLRRLAPGPRAVGRDRAQARQRPRPWLVDTLQGRLVPLRRPEPQGKTPGTNPGPTTG